MWSCQSLPGPTKFNVSNTGSSKKVQEEEEEEEEEEEFGIHNLNC